MEMCGRQNKCWCTFFVSSSAPSSARALGSISAVSRVWSWSFPKFRAEKRCAQASAHPLSQAHGGLFCVLTGFVCFWNSEWNARGGNVCSLWSIFIWHVCFFFRRLKITLDSEQPMLKEKRIIPSVWGGIKGFEHFLRGEYFSDCASD